MGFWSKAITDDNPSGSSVSQREARMKATIVELGVYERKEHAVIYDLLSKLQTRVDALENKTKVACPTCGDLHETKTWKEG